MPYAGHFLLFEMGKSKEEEEEGNAYEIGARVCLM
jgi:hypothetical protein